eukprot:4389405-Pyramimonas_sp.AAC.2
MRLLKKNIKKIKLNACLIPYLTHQVKPPVSVRLRRRANLPNNAPGRPFPRQKPPCQRTLPHAVNPFCQAHTPLTAHFLPPYPSSPLQPLPPPSLLFFLSPPCSPVSRIRAVPSAWQHRASASASAVAVVPPRSQAVLAQIEIGFDADMYVSYGARKESAGNRTLSRAKRRLFVTS